MIPPKANVERQNPISPLIQCGGQDESDDSEEETLEAKGDVAGQTPDVGQTPEVVGQTPDAELFVHESPSRGQSADIRVSTDHADGCQRTWYAFTG